MSEEPSVWEVRVGIFATEEQAEEVKERFTKLLCPEPEHAGPCPIPWLAYVLHGSDLDDPDIYSTLVEQAQIEQGSPRD